MNSKAPPNILNGFGGRICGKKLSELLRKVLDGLQQDYDVLYTLLCDEAWESAAEKAHRLKGSTYLFECRELLFFLEQISEKNYALIASAAFRTSYSQQMQICIDKLQQALEDSQRV